MGGFPRRGFLKVIGSCTIFGAICIENLQVVYSILKNLFMSSGDFLLPKVCLGCRSEGSTWCGQCAGSVWLNPFYVRDILGVPVFATALYKGPVIRVINQAKEMGSPIAQALLAKYLRASLQAVCARALIPAAPITPIRPELEAGSGSLFDPVTKFGSTTLIVPIPTTGHARRARGGDPLTDVVKQALRRFDTPVELYPLLKNTRSRLDQTGLTISEREKNTAGSFIWSGPGSPGPTSRSISPQSSQHVLVDDVVTTGATLKAALSAMHDAGIAVIGCAVVASTRRRSQFGVGV